MKTIFYCIRKVLLIGIMGVLIVFSFILPNTVFADTAPSPLWVVKYNGTGNGDDHSRKIATDISGNIYVTGLSYSGVSNDYVTIKYSNNGTQLWVA